MTPIFVACKGGTGSSLLAQTLIACGMNPGNDRTYYSDRFRNDNAEHSLMTALCHMWMDEDEFDLKWRVRGLHPEWDWLERDCNSSVTEKLRFVLERYKTEAERNNWSSFGLKVTRATDYFDKWIWIRDIVLHIWGDKTQFVSTLRDPITYIYRLRKDPRFLPHWGDHLIEYLKATKVWTSMEIQGSMFIPYPQAFEDGSIKDYVEKLGLEWTPEAENIYDRSRSTHIDPELVNEFDETFTLAELAKSHYNGMVRRMERSHFV